MNFYRTTVIFILGLGFIALLWFRGLVVTVVQVDPRIDPARAQSIINGLDARVTEQGKEIDAIKEATK